MRVIHILRDGSTVKDITGHVVQFEDAEPLYHYIHKINNKRIKKVNRKV